jgi:hypothetical protein
VRLFARFINAVRSDVVNVMVFVMTTIIVYNYMLQSTRPLWRRRLRRFILLAPPAIGTGWDRTKLGFLALALGDRLLLLAAWVDPPNGFGFASLHVMHVRTSYGYC